MRHGSNLICPECFIVFLYLNFNFTNDFHSFLTCWQAALCILVPQLTAIAIILWYGRNVHLRTRKSPVSTTIADIVPLPNAGQRDPFS